MQHLHEILKIIEGGVQQKSDQVSAYAGLLANKLEQVGENKAANNIRKQLQGNNKPSSSPDFSPTSLTAVKPIPVDKDSRLSLADTTYPLADELHIQLENETNEAVEEFLRFVKHADQLVEAGVGISPSMLIYGPPGCGKTALAHYIAAKLDMPLLTARCDTLVSSYLGSTAKNIRSLFDHASESPCVLFLDEFDSLAKARDDQHELGELKRVVVSLLQNIDALPQNSILLAATNHENLLDSAVWRRFSYRLQIPLPSKVIRESLLKQYLSKYKLDNIKPLIQATEGMSGALIQQACHSAVRTAVLEKSNNIDDSELLCKLIRAQHHSIFQSNISVEEKIIKLRGINTKLFTTRLLGKLFSISTGKISKIINR